MEPSETGSEGPSSRRSSRHPGIPARRMWLGTVERSRNHLSMTYGIDELRFETAYWYGDLDLPALENRFGRKLLDRVYFHILAFEATKVVSLAPETLDLGPHERFHTRTFEELWHRVVREVWAEWRYRNDRPDYHGPTILGEAVDDRPVEPATVQAGNPEVLVFCGGGKDSLVAMRLLERAGIPFDSYSYSHSIYGGSERQHGLIDALLDHSSVQLRRKHWVHDSFADSPVAELRPEYGAGSITLAETPASLFGALPVALAHGYTRLVLAHERSANVGNLIWEETGEDVNHQWGKSLEAERLLGRYIREQLVANTRAFSLLQPLYDVGIFTLLRQERDAVAATHSCNVRKPWCSRCPKCAYVWVNYMAYLPRDLVDDVFGENLLDVEDNQLYFRQMLGLEEHTPFECIGQIPEARLAFELCRRKGIRGRAMEVFENDVGTVDVEAIAERYLQVELDDNEIPEEIAARVGPLLLRVPELGQDLLATAREPSGGG